jgi:hypothetical protein
MKSFRAEFAKQRVAFVKNGFTIEWVDANTDCQCREREGLEEMETSGGDTKHWLT